MTMRLPPRMSWSMLLVSVMPWPHAADCLGSESGETGEPADLVGWSGVTGGLVAHVGCGDAERTLQSRVNDRYIVQGLATDAAAVAGPRWARSHDHIAGPGVWDPPFAIVK
ncbi:MAG: hypothetical protein ACQESR_19685 [Planctomycetota bacterium]